MPESVRSSNVTTSDPPGPAVKRRGRPRVFSDEVRRRVIIKAAYQVFVEEGFAGSTTTAIAAKARISKRSIYEVFTDKMALFGEVIREHRHLMLDLPRPADEQLPLLETLIHIFRLDIDDNHEREREAMLNLIVRESAQYPDLSDYLYKNHVLRPRDELIEWLQVQADRGRMPIDDMAVCAGMLMDIVFGALLPRKRLKSAEERAQRTEHIKKRLEIFLRGIQAER